MKKGFRTPSVKRSVSARTTGRVKRAVKRSVNPTYGKNGMGYINNPQKAVYNKVYNKTTFGVNDIVNSGSGSRGIDKKTFDTQAALTRLNQLKETVDIVNTTTNVSTFFSRFEFALKVCDDLKQYEYTGCLKNITPTQQKREFLEQVPRTINALIVRCHDKEIKKAQELKTEKGRHNRIIRFYGNLISDLNEYGAQYITETNISTIKDLAEKDNALDEINIALTPVKIELPAVETVVISSPISSEIPEIDYTKSAESDEETVSNATGCAVCGVAMLYFCLLLIAGILALVIGHPFIGFILISIYIVIVVVAYKIGKQ